MPSDKTDMWMPIYIGDYLSDTMHLTTEQHGAYLLLIMAYWKNHGPLCEEKIQSIVKLNGDSWQETKKVLAEFFDTSEPGKWYHKRIEIELQKATVRHEAAVKRGKAGAKVKWGS